jgi:hypothetical protein
LPRLPLIKRTIFNALVSAAFLILFAASAAVVGSMIVLALFDLAFGKKSKPPVDTEMVKSDQLEPQPKPKVEISESRP